MLDCIHNFDAESRQRENKALSLVKQMGSRLHRGNQSELHSHGREI